MNSLRIAIVAAASCSSALVAQTTTILTHGFTTGEKGVWVQSMAEAILARAGNVGSVYRYTGASGVWTPVPEAGGDGSQENVILIFNWVPESASTTGPNWRYTQAAGDALHAMLRDPAYAAAGDGPQDLLKNRAVHFIGHSRGACVISEAIRRLALAGIPVDQMTTHDPHPNDGTLDPPYNVNWGDPIPVRWSNVAWADNYWRADGGGLINGLDFDGIPLANTYNVLLDEGALNCCAYSFAHLDVHLWYHGTIDLSPNPDDGEQVISNLARTLWYPQGWTSIGYFHAALGGGADRRPPIPPGVAPEPGSAPLLFNGNFEQGSRAGWTAHGGAVPSIVATGGDWAARLSAAAALLVHNRAHLPEGALKLSFRARRIGIGATDDLLVAALQRAEDPTPVALVGGAWAVAALPSAFETYQVVLPASLAGRTSRISFRLLGDSGGGTIESTIELDEISATGLEHPADLDGGGSVGAADLAILLSSWGPCPACPADLDGNGSVDAADLASLLAGWTG